jgi:hypothetical protein
MLESSQERLEQQLLHFLFPMKPYCVLQCQMKLPDVIFLFIIIIDIRSNFDFLTDQNSFFWEFYYHKSSLRLKFFKNKLSHFFQNFKISKFKQSVFVKLVNALFSYFIYEEE